MKSDLSLGDLEKQKKSRIFFIKKELSDRFRIFFILKQLPMSPEIIVFFAFIILGTRN